MAVQSIKMFNAPVLKMRCEEIGEVDREVVQMGIDMMETFEHHKKKALGLAANQLGFTKRMIVVLHLEMNKPMLLLNPEVTWYSKHELINAPEGCLSYPSLQKVITRPAHIVVKAMDIEGKKLELEMSGLQARIICHEIDHLNGCCKVGNRKR